MSEPTFASVARKIGDLRLEEALRKLAVNIKNEIHNADFVPLRAKVRSDVKRLKAEARRFEVALNRVSKLFLALPANESDCLPVARQAMCNVIALCDTALSITSPKGGVRKKPGRVTCALIVIEAWAFVHGRTPGHHNDFAQEACDDYWRACGGTREGDAGRWRRQITAARANKGAFRRYVHDEIRRCAKGTE